MEVEASREVAATAGAVWDVLADASRRSEWLVELSDVRGHPPERLQAGDRFRGIATGFGHRLEGASEVVESQPGARLAEDIVVGLRARSVWTVEPADDGRTVVRHRMEVTMPQGPLGPIIRPIVALYIRRLERRSLRALEALVRDGAGSASRVPSGDAGP